MEFTFNVSSVLPGQVSVINSKDSSSSLQIYDAESGYDFNQDARGSWIYTEYSNTRIEKKKEELENIIDSMGFGSAQAQNLKTPVTSLTKFLSSKQQKIYMLRDVREPKCVIGMLKVGIKRLFVRDGLGAHHEVDPLCVLDFYVHESKQRRGFGHKLFDFMLKVEGVEPDKLAIDSPSHTFLAFFHKHYNMNNPLQQNNNYVIYPGFLQNKTGHNGKQTHNSKEKIKNAYSHSVESVPAHLTADEKKSKAYYSTGHCLGGDDNDANQEYRKKKVQDTNDFPTCPNVDTYQSHGENWGVQGAMHSYKSGTQEIGDWKSVASSKFMTHVDPIQHCTPKRWDEMNSSWNVLGVRPHDYGSSQKEA